MVAKGRCVDGRSRGTPERGFPAPALPAISDGEVDPADMASGAQTREAFTVAPADSTQGGLGLLLTIR